MEGGKLRAGRRPFNRNLLLDIVITFSALPLLVYCAAAFFVVPAVVGFLPVTITLIILVPTAVLGAGLLPVQWVRKFLASRLAARKANENDLPTKKTKARLKEERDDGAAVTEPEPEPTEDAQEEVTGQLDRTIQTMFSQQGELFLKIGTAIFFVTVLQLAWYI